MLKIHWRFIIICVILLAISAVRFQKGEVQQDNYLGYAALLSSGLKNISFFDSRLFPGLPIIIYILNLILNNVIFSGYLAVFLAFIGSYIILYKLTKSTFSFIPLIFPPVMLNQSTLVATEIPTLFVILLVLYLFKKKRFALALLLSSFGFWVRAIAIIPGLIILVFLLAKDGKKALEYLPYFFLPLILLVLFNSYFFGSNDLFHQLVAYKQLGVNTLGIAQIFADIPRAWRWGWYRIFASGVFYFFLSLILLSKSILKFRKEREIFGKIIFMTIIALLIFIYSLNSVPFLENLGRYLAPTFPLFWVLFQDRFKNSKIMYLLLPISALVVLF